MPKKGAVPQETRASGDSVRADVTNTEDRRYVKRKAPDAQRLLRRARDQVELASRCEHVDSGLQGLERRHMVGSHLPDRLTNLPPGQSQA